MLSNRRGVQELKSSGGVVYSLYSSTPPEAGGLVGEVPVAVSWVWRPGAPRGGGCVWLRSEPASALAQFAGAVGADACEFMRDPVSSPCGCSSAGGLRTPSPHPRGAAVKRVFVPGKQKEVYFGVALAPRRLLELLLDAIGLTLQNQ